MARFDSFKALHQSIAAAREAQETGILRFAAEIAADDDRIAAHTCRTTIHEWIASRVPGALPPEAADHGTFSFRQGGSHCQAVRVLREGHDLWAVRLRSPDPSAPADAWVTEAGVGWSPGAPPVFHLRLLRSSNGVDARYLEPKVPDLAVRLASVLELRQFGEPVTGEPWLVKSVPDAERFCARLTDPQRRLPILALSVPDDADDPHRPTLDAERLARSCVGLALVAVIPAEYAWELTDRFGRRLSVYQGAVRIYLPGFTAQANERDHRLILGMSLSDPEAIERTTNSILRSVAEMSLESQPELPFEEVRRMANAEYSGTDAPAAEETPGPTPATREPVAGPTPAAAPTPAPPVEPPVVPARVAAAARREPIPTPTPEPGPGPMATPAAAVPASPAEPPPPSPAPPDPQQPFWARSVHSAPRPAARPAATTRAAAPPEPFPGRATPPRFPPKPPPTRLPPAEPRPGAPRAEPTPPADPTPAPPTDSAFGPASPPATTPASPPATTTATPKAPASPAPASASSPVPGRSTPKAPPPTPGPEPPETPSEPLPPESPSAPSPESPAESPSSSASVPEPAATAPPEPAGPGFFARLLAGLRSLFGARPRPALALPEPKPEEAETEPEAEPVPAPVTPEEPSPAATPAEDEERTRLEKEVRTLSLELDSVRRLLTRTEQEKAKSVDELAEARERADEAERRFDLSTSQQQALADRLLDLGEDPHPQAPLPTDWARFNEWCETQLAGKVLLTPRAQREVKRAQFADVPLAARCLLWLANDFRDGRLGRKPADRRPTVEDGVHNARCGGDAFSVKWRGKSRRVDWHLKSGGSTHDPRRCLRIYYFWDSARNQAVVASMPAHIRTAMT